MINTNGSRTVAEALNGFLYHKGRASLHLKEHNVVPEVIYNCLVNFRNKHNNENDKVLIITKSSEDVTKIHSKLVKFSPSYKTDLNVIILSRKFVHNTNINAKLTITLGLEENPDEILKFASETTFILNIMLKDFIDSFALNSIISVLPSIRITANHANLNRLRIGTPVEEECISCSLDDDDSQLNSKYDEFISDCVKRFGSFENVAYARTGNPKTNQSASEVRESIAFANGWNYHLDVTSNYQKSIDDAYNPNVLKELSDNFYILTRKRRDLLTDNKSKIPVIINLVKQNLDKRIAIVCVRGEFANDIEKSINAELGYTACLGYHNELEPAYMRDEYGEFIRYKSGQNKGELKLFKSKALETANLASFQASEVNILCIKNSSSTSLAGTFDIVIFTSPICLDMVEFKKRYNHINIEGVPNKTYRIYCEGTIEELKLNSMKKYSHINVLKKETNISTIDLDTGDILL